MYVLGKAQLSMYSIPVNVPGFRHQSHEQHDSRSIFSVRFASNHKNTRLAFESHEATRFICLFLWILYYRDTVSTHFGSSCLVFSLRRSGYTFKEMQKVTLHARSDSTSKYVSINAGSPAVLVEPLRENSFAIS